MQETKRIMFTSKSFSQGKFLVENLMIEMKPVVIEKYEFESRAKLELKNFFLEVFALA